MAKQSKVSKLLAQSVPLVLKVDDGAHVLELRLAWTMWAAMLIESRLRAEGVLVNILQDLRRFWEELDCNRLTIGIWAASQQENPEYADEEGFKIISSFLTPDNYGDAMIALKEAFLQSLSESRRNSIKESEANPTPALSQP